MGIHYFAQILGISEFSHQFFREILVAYPFYRRGSLRSSDSRKVLHPVCARSQETDPGE